MLGFVRYKTRRVDEKLWKYLKEEGLDGFVKEKAIPYVWDSSKEYEVEGLNEDLQYVRDWLFKNGLKIKVLSIRTQRKISVRGLFMGEKEMDIDFWCRVTGSIYPSVQGARDVFFKNGVEKISDVFNGFSAHIVSVSKQVTVTRGLWYGVSSELIFYYMNGEPVGIYGYVVGHDLSDLGRYVALKGFVSFRPMWVGLRYHIENIGCKEVEEVRKKLGSFDDWVEKKEMRNMGSEEKNVRVVYLDYLKEFDDYLTSFDDDVRKELIRIAKKIRTRTYEEKKMLFSAVSYPRSEE